MLSTKICRTDALDVVRDSTVAEICGIVTRERCHEDAAWLQKTQDGFKWLIFTWVSVRRRTSIIVKLISGHYFEGFKKYRRVSAGRIAPVLKLAHGSVVEHTMAPLSS